MAAEPPSQNCGPVHLDQAPRVKERWKIALERCAPGGKSTLKQTQRACLEEKVGELVDAGSQCIWDRGVHLSSQFPVGNLPLESNRLLNQNAVVVCQQQDGKVEPSCMYG